MLTIAIDLPSNNFVAGESVPLEVKLANTGPSPMDVPELLSHLNWQPTYTLTGPGYPQGATFSFCSIVSSARLPDPAKAKLRVVTLPPGETLDEVIPLHEWARLKEAGEYRISAQIESNGEMAVSNTLTFRLDPKTFVSSSLSVDEGVASADVVRVIWLGQTGAIRRLGESFFIEDRPDLGTFEPPGANMVRAVGPRAADAFCPWANHDRTDSGHDWRGWREGAALFAQSSDSDTPLCANLQSADARLIRPALMVPDGSLEVFFLAADRREIGLTRFVNKTASVLWRVTAPAQVLSARGALAPQSQGSERRVLLVGQELDEALVTLISPSEDGKPGTPRTIRIPQCNALANSQPGLRVDEFGNTHAAVVFTRDISLGGLAVLDAVFPADGVSPVKSDITTIGVLPNVLAAAATFRIAASGPMVRSWVALLDSGELVVSEAPDEKIQLPAQPALPLEIVRLSSATYLLLLDSENGPRLVVVP